MTKWLVIAFLLFAVPVHAQQPVNRWADWASYGTAAVNPTWSAVDAARSKRPWCNLGRLALTEGLITTTELTMKHFIFSPRPCAGCDLHGMPSGHSARGMEGLLSRGPTGARHWQLGLSFAWATQELRGEDFANRHTGKQRIAGVFLGASAELIGQLIRCEE